MHVKDQNCNAIKIVEAAALLDAITTSNKKSHQFSNGEVNTSINSRKCRIACIVT